MLSSSRLIAFVRVTDYQKARDFYGDVLGLEFVSQDEYALVLRSGANMIRVVKTGPFTPERSTVLGWEVTNIERAAAELQTKGVTFEKYPWVDDPTGVGIWSAPGGDKVAWFKDPDGSVLSISQHK
jgi:catechol 2,3-dioxygenase-like lactoylglutathione lyase family enzyme